MSKAIGYVRVSSKEQAEHFSPGIQRQKIQDYAAKNGLQLIKIFEEAASGWKLNARMEFYKMLDYIKEYKIEHVLFYLADRVSRNTDDYVLLKNTNVKFHNVTSGRSFTPADPDDFDETAQFERDQVEAKLFSGRLRKRVMDAQHDMLEQGFFPGFPPLGYIANPLWKVGPNKSRIMPCPKTAPLIKQMFELWATGVYTIRGITQKMRNLGLKSKKGNNVHRAVISQCLHNSTYFGSFVWGGKVYDNKGSYEPIISKALFDQAQVVFEQKSVKQKYGKDYKYKGLLECGYCHCSVVGVQKIKTLKSTGETKSYTYYSCTQGRGKCNLPKFTEQQIDKYFDEALGELYIDPDVYEMLKVELQDDYKIRATSAAEEEKRLHSEQTQIKNRRTKLYENFCRALVPEDFYKEEFDKMSKRLEQIEKRLAELETGETDYMEASLDTLELMKDFKNQYFSANSEKRKRLNALMFGTIIVCNVTEPKTKEIEFEIPAHYPLDFIWNEPFKTLFEIKLEQQESEIPASQRAPVIIKKAVKKAKIGKWRGRRDSNSRPLA